MDELTVKQSGSNVLTGGICSLYLLEKLKVREVVDTVAFSGTLEYSEEYCELP